MKVMTALMLAQNYRDQKFKIVGGRVIWEAISVKKRGCYVSRVTEKGGKPFMLGLRYIGRYIRDNTKIEII